MAPLLGLSCFKTAPFNISSNARLFHRFLLSRSHVWSSSSSLCSRISSYAPFASGHEVELWASVQPQIWLLLPPFLVALPLVAVSPERKKFGFPFEPLARFFASVPRRQEVERNLVQITMVLLLSTAVKSNVAAPDPYNYYENIPPDISDQQIRKRIQKPKSPQAERCVQKCVGTCIRGGAGSPGEGPLNVRKPLVVFKEGFRTRQYCLVECSEICNLIEDGKDGP